MNASDVRRVAALAMLAFATLAAPALAQRAVGLGAAAGPHFEQFTTHVSLLPESGGKLTLSLNVRRASSCTVTAKPAVAGLPWHARCSHRRSRAITFPPNNQSVPVVYRVKVTAHGAHGTSSRSITVTVHAHKPPPKEEKTKGGEEEPTSVVGDWELSYYSEGFLISTSAAAFFAEGKCTFDNTEGGSWEYAGESLTFRRKVEFGPDDIETLVGTGPPAGPIKGTSTSTESTIKSEFVLTRVQG